MKQKATEIRSLVTITNHEFVEFLLSRLRQSTGHFHHLQLLAVVSHPTTQLVHTVHEVPHLQRYGTLFHVREFLE